MNRLIATTLIFSLLTAGVGFAVNDGICPGCGVEIRTEFWGDGITSFLESVGMYTEDGSGGIDEAIYNWGYTYTIKNVRWYQHEDDGWSLEEDKYIEVYPDVGTAEIDKGVWWYDTDANIYREAGTLYDDGYFWDTFEFHNLPYEYGELIDNIYTDVPLYVYQSVGIDDPFACEEPESPEWPGYPCCEWYE
jgi:hypothetical protein